LTRREEQPQSKSASESLLPCLILQLPKISVDLGTPAQFPRYPRGEQKKKEKKKQAGIEPATTTSAEEEIHLGKRPLVLR
jgi:hypothetical protein